MLRQYPSFLVRFLTSAGLLAGGAFEAPEIARAQSVAPEAATAADEAPAATSAITPRQQDWLNASINERVNLAEQIGEDGVDAIIAARGA